MAPTPADKPQIGIGPTEALNLRVSVAVLAKVIFERPQDGREMLVLERTTTLLDPKGRQEVVVRAKPFGGGVQLKQPEALSALIGDFHFDSRRSRNEKDFRLFIRQRDWERVRAFCLKHLKDQDDVLETSPDRELLEEFEDALDVKILADQYRSTPLGVVVEDLPKQTKNLRSLGSPTVRICNLFRVVIKDDSLIETILDRSERYADENLQQLARQDYDRGGIGRANSVLALPLDRLLETYLALLPEERGRPVRFEGYQLDGNVPAILGEVKTTNR